jgi:hypothetical protein
LRPLLIADFPDGLPNGVADRGKRSLEIGADDGHYCDDGERDSAGDKGVFDRGRARLVLDEAPDKTFHSNILANTALEKV